MTGGKWFYIQVASLTLLASATPSVAYARFARSLTWAWWGREGTWLDNIYLMTQSTGCTQHGQPMAMLYFSQKTSIHHSLPPSLPARLLACLPAGQPTDRSTYLLTHLPTYTYSTYLLNFIEIFLCSMRFFMEKVLHVILAFDQEWKFEELSRCKVSIDGGLEYYWTYYGAVIWSGGRGQWCTYVHWGGVQLTWPRIVTSC